MKANNRLSFQDKLDKQLAIRNKELVQLKLLMQTYMQPHEKAIINRLVIPHAYSHYEGFIKKSSILYLNYFKTIYEPIIPLPDNINAVYLRKYVKNCFHEKSINKYIELINIIKNKPLEIDFDSDLIIDTHSNLESKYLKEIILICGINYDSYWEKKSSFIDNVLLRNRNMISHGELNPIDDKTACDCLENVMEILIMYKQKLEEKI